MRKTTKTRLGLLAAGTGVAALAVTGMALPASADDNSRSSDTTSTATDVTSSLSAFQTWVSDTISAGDTTLAPVTGISPDTGVGDVTLVEGPLVGDVLSGNQAPVGSGNETPIGSGNDVSAPVGSGNDTDVTAPVGSGNDVSAPVEVPVEAPVGSGNESSTDTGLSVGDIGANVDQLVENVTGDLDLGLGDILR